MTIDDISERLGRLTGQLEMINAKLDEHIEINISWRKTIDAKLIIVCDAISQIKGARSLFVWLFGIVMGLAVVIPQMFK